MKSKFLIATSSLLLIAACGQKTDSAPVAPASQVSPGDPSKGIDSKELATCAANNNSVQRLSCFDDLAKKYGQVPTTIQTTTGNTGNWRTSTDTDPLTDKSVHYALLDATDGRGRFGEKVHMTVRCKNGKTEAYVNWATFLGSDSITVTSRIDKAQAEKAYWNISTDHKASFMPSPVPTLKKMTGGTTYAVNLTPFSESPITAIFDIAGAEEAFKDIRRDCKW
jgi:type VI secretion system protein VasI